MQPPTQHRKWAIPLSGGLGLLLWLPAIYFNVQRTAPGTDYLYAAIPLAMLLVGLGLVAVRAGTPRTTKDAKTTTALSWLWPATTGAIHPRRVALLAAVTLLASSTLLIMVAIIAGPRGVAAAGAGLGVLAGAALLLGAFALAGYRPLLPSAATTALAAIFVEIQAVADAWNVAHEWNAWGLVFAIVFASIQAMGAEAAFRQTKERALWAAWTGIGTGLSLALPLWVFFGEQGSMAIPLGMALASLVWGIGANFALAAVPNAMRWTGAAIFASWSFIIVLMYVFDGREIFLRLQAAGLVAATAAVAAGAIAFWVGDKKRAPANTSNDS